VAGIGRRGFVAGIGLGAGAGILAAGPRRAFAIVIDPPPAMPLRRSLCGLGGGAVIERWTVEAVHPERMGAVPVLLCDGDGDRFQVDVLRRDDDGPRPIAATGSMALFLANRGDGERATREEQGLAVMALARALAEREARGARPPALLTFRERRDIHPLGIYSVE
jgi:hypothetical protein